MTHEPENGTETTPDSASAEEAEAPEIVEEDDLFLDEDVDPDGVVGDDGYLEVAAGPAGAASDGDAPGEPRGGTPDGPVDLVEARIAELLEQIEAAKADARETHERLLRKAADFENAKRRHQKEKDDLTRYAAESVLKDIVPVLDDLERALEHGKDSEDRSLLDGVDMVRRKFVQALERRGVTSIDAVGQAFDPQYHEAIQQVEDASVPHNTVAQAFQKGYLLHDRLIRPALVVVAQGGPPRAASPAAETDATLADAAATEQNDVAPDEGSDA